MKLVRNLFCREDRHVGGKPRVQRRHHLVRRDPAIRLEVHDLPFGMRARVGPSRRVDLEVLAGDLSKRPLQLGFDSPSVCLLLPAGKFTSVVLQHDFDIHFLRAPPLPHSAERR